MATDQTTLSIDKTTKHKAELMAKKMHLSLSGVARILLNDFADGKIKIATVMVADNGDIITPKEQKILEKSLNDVRKGKNIEGPFKSANDFIKSMK